MSITLPENYIIKYRTKDGETKCMVANNGKTATVIGERSGLQQISSDKFQKELQENLPVQYQQDKATFSKASFSGVSKAQNKEGKLALTAGGVGLVGGGIFNILEQKSALKDIEATGRHAKEMMEQLSKPTGSMFEGVYKFFDYLHYENLSKLAKKGKFMPFWTVKAALVAGGCALLAAEAIMGGINTFKGSKKD